MPRDWTAHDDAVPFHDERLARLNGTNLAGRRPHGFEEPTLQLRCTRRADNDNSEKPTLDVAA